MGQNMFMHAVINADDGREIPIIICITNDLKRQGYGKSDFSHAYEKDIRYWGLLEGADISSFICKERTSGYLDGITGE